MSSVTTRIEEIKQPFGGYIKPSTMEVCALDDGIMLHDKENVPGSRIGTVVDYLTRFHLYKKSRKTGRDATMTAMINSFGTCIEGAKIAEQHGVRNAMGNVEKWLAGIAS